MLRFSEPVTPIAIGVLDRSGARVALRADVDGQVVRAALPPTPSGPYLVSYPVTSLDSHPVAGALAFSVGSAERLAAPSGLDAAGTGAPARGASRVVHDLAVLVAAGGALSWSSLRRSRASARCSRSRRRWRARARSRGRTPRRRAIPFDPPRPGVLARRTGDHPRPGRDRHVCRGCDDRRQRIRPRGAGGWLLALGASVVIASFALSGHPAAAEPRALAATLIVAHVAAAAFRPARCSGCSRYRVRPRADGPPRPRCPVSRTSVYSRS